MITLNTNKGAIVIELDHDKAPATCENFLSYVNGGHYDGTIFHRVIPSFMIQGGGFSADMQQKPTQAAIANEADNGLANDTGTLAMARTGDPHSATAQFFINVNDNSFLNHTEKSPNGWGYCVFGKVVEGMDVVMEMSTVPTGNHGGHGDVPIEALVIETAVNADNS
jgi:peptidyl-prolyl cis-trans isomerase B (cyclophilin B)